MSTKSCGNMLTFNMQHGYSESLLRGYKSGFLTEAEYHHISMCENLEDVRLNLQETEYGGFMSEEVGTITPKTIEKCAMKKLAEEWTFMRAHATQPLAQFMDYTSYEFMIDNVIMILKNTILNPTMNPSELFEMCNPLGQLPYPIVKSIARFENTPKGFEDLFHAFLVELPIGKYFIQYLHTLSTTKLLSSTTIVKSLIEDNSITLMQYGVTKLYLEDFYSWCQGLEGDTTEIMTTILKTKADTMTISIVLNSFSTIYNEPQLRKIRSSLLPSVGFLYPEGVLKLNEVEDQDSLGKVLASYPVYSHVFDAAIQSNQLSIDDAFYTNEVRLLEGGFDSQFHYACFYSYCHLKLQEIRNLFWISECIIQKQRAKIDKYIPLFSSNAPWRNGKLGF